MMELYEERRPQYSALQLGNETLVEVVKLLETHGFIDITAHFGPKTRITAKDGEGNDSTIQGGDYVFFLRTLRPPFRSMHLLTMSADAFEATYKRADFCG